MRGLGRVTVAALAASSAAVAQGAEWRKIVPSSGEVPQERRSAVLAYNDAKDQVVLFGGRTSEGDALDDVWVFDVASEAWTKVDPEEGAAPSGRYSLAGGIDAVNDRLLIFGGEEDGKVVNNEVWAFEFQSNSWVDLTPSEGPSPLPRYGHAGGVVTTATNKTAFIVSHGFDKADRFSDSFLFNMETSQWVEVTPSADSLPFGRCLVAGAVLADPLNENNAILGMMGGCGSGGYGPCPSNELWTLQVSGIDTPGTAFAEWTQAPNCMRGRNYGAMAGSSSLDGPGSFLVFGGEGGPVVGRDQEGQLNSVSLNNLETSQVVLGGDAPGQAGGNAQPSMTISAANVLWLQTGGSSDLFVLDLSSAEALSSLSQEECVAFAIPALRVTHGVLMGLSWGFLLPIGVFIGRFGRAKNPLWFKLHRGIQSVGLLLAIAGFLAAMFMVSGGKFLAVPHSLIGVAVTFIGIQQPLNAYFRPHKVAGEPTSRSRSRWEAWHKYSGRLAIVLGLVNPFWGISYFTSTTSPGFVIYASWVAVYILVFTYLTARGLPYTANGPSKLANSINSFLCGCLTPWDDTFQPRRAEPGVKPLQVEQSANTRDVEAEAKSDATQQ